MDIISVFEKVLSGELKRFPDKTWQDNSNVKKVFRHVMFNKQKINSYEDLYKISNKFLNKYKISTILINFDYSMYKLITFCFPEYYFIFWKFNKVEKSKWDIQSIRIKAMKELIEKELRLNINDIPNVISPSFLKKNYPKLLNVYNKYYHEDLFSWVDEVYPDVFNRDTFYSNIAKDGTVLKTKDEKTVHNYLLDKGFKVKYFQNENSKKDKLHNKKHNENYVPDWLVNDHLIVEYFGLYDSKRKTEFSLKYANRTHRKIEFYKTYCNENTGLNFLAIYPDDIKDNFANLNTRIN